MLPVPPVHALAQYYLYIELHSGNAFYKDVADTWQLPFNEAKSIDGDRVGSATEYHIKPEEILTSDDSDCDKTRCIATLGTKLNAFGTAYYPPGGYAWSKGIAQTGFTVHLNKDAKILMVFREIVYVYVTTSKPGESAYANFKYKVTWNGEVVQGKKNGILSSLSNSQSFAHVDGVCITGICSTGDDFNINSYDVDLQGLKGVNTFLIDPVFDTDAIAVPAPLPLLGVGAAFGYSRKLRRRIKCSRTPEVMSAIC